MLTSFVGALEMLCCFKESRRFAACAAQGFATLGPRPKLVIDHVLRVVSWLLEVLDLLHEPLEVVLHTILEF